jgi:hypothetical protein
MAVGMANTGVVRECGYHTMPHPTPIPWYNLFFS